MSVNQALSNKRKRWMEYRLESLMLDNNLTISDISEIILLDQALSGYLYWDGIKFTLAETPGGKEYDGYVGVDIITNVTSGDPEITINNNKSILDATTSYSNGVYTTPTGDYYLYEFVIQYSTDFGDPALSDPAEFYCIFDMENKSNRSLPFVLDLPVINTSVRTLEGNLTRYFPAGRKIGMVLKPGTLPDQDYTCQVGITKIMSGKPN